MGLHWQVYVVTEWCQAYVTLALPAAMDYICLWAEYDFDAWIKVACIPS